MRSSINLFESNDEIHEFCKKYGIQNYTVTPEGIDVYQSVYLANCRLPEIPFQFNIVQGCFDCNSDIQTLKNSPKVVHGYFDCISSKLTSLQDIPKFVHGEFYCSSAKLPPWESRYLLFSEVQGEIWFSNKKLNAFFDYYQNKKNLIPQALKNLRLLQLKWEQENA